MKRILFFTLAVLLSTLSASAYDFKVDGIAYSFNNSYKPNATYFYVARGSDKKNAISIPSRVTDGGYTLPVATIAVEAFKDYTNLTSVSIPSSVTLIGYSAFEGCTSLTSVTLPNSITVISEALFKNCTGLPSVTIPNSVTQIYKSAFEGCTGLTTITIPNSVTSIADSAFYGCSNLKYMQLMCTTPPSISGNSIPSGTLICVRFGAYDAYKKDTNWSRFPIVDSYMVMGNDKGGGSFGGSGSGTKADPYLIFNPIQLHNIRNFTGYDDVYFKLM